MDKEQGILLWNKCLEIIKDNLSDDQYNAWFSPIVAFDFNKDGLYLEVPSLFFVERIEEQFCDLLKKTLKRVFKYDVNVFYRYDLSGSDSAKDKSKDASITLKQPKNAAKNPFITEQVPDIDPQLNSYNTFENYCGSMSNKLAVSIGLAIAANPQCKTFNPMFLFGTTGVGKTHLVQAIGLKAKELNPNLRVLYVTARVFESQYTTAVRNNKTNDFINFYQSIDLLILDDIQEFAGKVGTQNTFYYIFNHLQQHGKQIIMSSDCRPADMDGFVPRLVSRFKWGVTVEISKPDYSLRRDVLNMRALQDGLSISCDVLDYIASNVTDSVRELEGIMTSLLAYSTVLNSDITIDLASSVISNAVKTSKKQITFEMIVETVCGFYNVNTDAVYGKTRKREISDARQMVMYLAKELTSLSSTNIGVRLSRDHATVLHSCRTVKERISVDKKLQEDVEQIQNELKK
ncbi:MAG: chromosomal replication initiator protein DnaA [Bacteroidales bacterium]|nr:chromosomal replication initiator protein DnaA [Bacteroidales bacterium]